MFITNFVATTLTNIDKTTNIVEDTSKDTLSYKKNNQCHVGHWLLY